MQYANCCLCSTLVVSFLAFVQNSSLEAVPRFIETIYGKDDQESYSIVSGELFSFLSSVSYSLSQSISFTFFTCDISFLV